jgi:hypothetical protein
VVKEQSQLLGHASLASQPSDNSKGLKDSDKKEEGGGGLAEEGEKDNNNNDNNNAVKDQIA